MKLIQSLLILFLLQGCITTKPNPILISKEESWYIPQGVTFQAKKQPADELKTYQAEENLIVLYMGKYLELEQKANSCTQTK